MERWINGTTVVLIWGGFNAILASLLAGFTASGFIGGAGPAGALAFGVYGASTTLVFVIALLVWAGKRRHEGPRIPPRPGAALLLAAAVAVSWLGLALGPWAAYAAAGPLIAAIVLEFYPRERP
jgi:hypothetical protein